MSPSPLGSVRGIVCMPSFYTSVHDMSVLCIDGLDFHQTFVVHYVTFKLSLMTYRCLHGHTPRYLIIYLTPASEVAPLLRLSSGNRHQLIIPRCRLNVDIWTSVFFDRWSDGLEIRDPHCGCNSYKQFLKTVIFSFC